jgi:hypothetical protein
MALNYKLHQVKLKLTFNVCLEAFSKANYSTAVSYTLKRFITPDPDFDNRRKM